MIICIAPLHQRYVSRAIIILAIIICITVTHNAFAIEAYGKPEQPYISRLENGMEVVLIPNHSVKMIAANIIIKVGSRDEEWESWGAAHFLEHLLFNGTINRSQEKIYADFDRLGAYHNAHTGSHFTDFMLLSATNNFLPALSIMAEMVFSSTLPRWKFEKERGIVMEEIARSSPDIYRISQKFNEKLFENTSLSRNVLGTVKSIEALQRDQVLEFYHGWYNPNNMTLFVTGDFDPDTMATKLSEIVSVYPPRDLPKRKHIDQPNYSNYANQIYSRVSGKIKNNSIIIGQAAPLPRESDFASILFLRDLLEKRMESDFPTGTRGSTDLIFDHDLCILKTEISFPDSFSSKSIIDKFDSIIAGMISKPFKQYEIDQLANNYRADEIFTSEKLHYYGVMNLAYWALVPFEEFKVWPARMSDFTPRYLKTKTSQWLQTKDRLIMSFEPDLAMNDNTMLTSSSDNTEVQRFESADSPLLLIRTDRSARVFAMHILFQDRWKWDEKYGVGSVDILHKLMKKGKNKRGKSLSERLGSISGSLKTFDSPYIPYDDYYTTPEYSYMRFETLPEHWESGMQLIFDVLNQIPTDDANLTEAKQLVASAYSKSIQKPVKVGRKMLRSSIIPKSALSASIYSDNNDIDTKALLNLKSEFFSPENMIISISSPVSAPEINDKLRSIYNTSKYKAGGIIGGGSVTTPSRTVGGTELLTLSKSQGAVVMGKVIQNVESSERLALIIANAVLNERLSMVLREQQGLAYSLGSRISYRSGKDDSIWALWEITVGTRQENLDKVKEGIEKIINDFQDELINRDTIERISSSIAGRQMMRSMARIGQAYSMGTGEYYWNNPESGTNISDELNALSKEDVNNAANKFLIAHDFQIIIVN